MPDMYYEFTAVSSPPDNVALYIATGGIPRDLTSAETQVVWQDILQCFIHGGFHGAAKALRTLSYDWVSSGVFTLHGPLAQQRHIVHMLFPYRRRRPDHSMSVSVEFFRSHHIPHLSVHLHQGAVRSWHVDYASPPPHIRETSPRNKNPTSVLS